MLIRFRDVLGSIFAILALHFPAIYFGLYHRNNGIDSAMHALGGLLGVLLYLWLLQQTPLRRHMGRPSLFLVSLTAVPFSITCSYLWEIYEYYRWRWWPQTYVYEHSLPDTLFDVFLAGAAAVLAAFVYDRLSRAMGAHPLDVPPEKRLARLRQLAPSVQGFAARVATSGRAWSE